jgi:molecular chaperone GrpE
MPTDMPDNKSTKDDNLHKNAKNAERGSDNEPPVELLTHPAYEELLQKLGEAEQKANQYWERILRMQAESENALRRTERDVANAHKYALEKFIGDLLPIVDSLELCVANAPEDPDAVLGSVLEGVNLTLKMFYNALEKYGIKQLNPVNEPFDPELQQAISMQHDPAVKPGTVISVLQKGYTLNNRLVRPALVVVSKADA